MALVRAVGAALIVVVLTACTTGTGGGFSREASRERSARNQPQPSPSKPSTTSPSPSPFPSAVVSDQEQAPQPPPSPTITIHASPPQARISLNGRFLGSGSATFESSGLGQSVTVKVEATAYRTQTLTFSLWGQRDTIEVDLVPITGILEVGGTELEGASLSVDGQGLHQGTNRVLIGSHTVRANRFGFVGQSREVFLVEDQTTTVEFNLLPAPFEFSALRSDRPEGFNPESAAIAATAELSFHVSGPGHARLTVSDSRGKVLETWEFPKLLTWDQHVNWSGRDSNGEPLPDGAYELTLTGGPEELDTLRSTGVVRIDRAFVDHDRPSLGPAAGLLWVPTAEVLSAGTLQWSVLGLGHNDGAVSHIPLSTALRFSPARDWEWFGQLTARLWSDSSLNSGYATLSLKHRFDVDSPGFRAAWLLGATAATWLEGDPGVPPTDFLTTFPALKASLPISWSWGRWTLLVAPEVDLSFWSPSSAYVTATGAEEGLRAWAYGRAGLLFDPGPFSIGVSAAARTLSFDRGFGLLDPAHLGLEAHWPVADSALTLTGYLSVSAYSTVDYAWYGGLGMSLLLPPSITLDLASQLSKSP